MQGALVSAIVVPAARKRLFLLLRTRFARSGEFTIKVPTACKPLILLNVSASGHAHASHLFTMPENGLTAMDRDAEGIEFAIL